MWIGGLSISTANFHRASTNNGGAFRDGMAQAKPAAYPYRQFLGRLPKTSQSTTCCGRDRERGAVNGPRVGTQ